MKRILFVILMLCSACETDHPGADKSIGNSVNMSIDPKVTQLGCPPGISPVPIQKIAPAGDAFPSVSDDRGRSLFFTRDFSQTPSIRAPEGTLLVVRGGKKLTRDVNRVFGERVAIEAAAFGAGRFMAVGDTDDGLAILESVDGVTWEQVETFPAVTGVLSASIALGPTGWLVLVGRFRDNRGRDFYVTALRSSDGKRWSQPEKFPLVDVEGLAGNLKGYVAVAATFAGRDESSSGSSVPRAIWSSSDGLVWHELLDSPRRRSIISVAASRSGFFVGGSIDESSSPAVWRSRDGLKWQEVRGCSRYTDGWPRSVGSIATSGNGVIAAGRGDLVMVSADGSHWRQAQIAFSGRPASEMHFGEAVFQANDLFISFEFLNALGQSPAHP